MLTAIGLTPGGSSTVRIYTQTIIEQHNNNTINIKKTHLTASLRRVRTVPRLCELCAYLYC